jgi:hypothetical protein
MGIKCKVPTHQLRKNYPSCNDLIRVICGRVFHEDEGPFNAHETIFPINCDPSLALLVQPTRLPAQKRLRSQLPLVLQPPHLQQHQSSHQSKKRSNNRPSSIQQQLLQPQLQLLQPPPMQQQVPLPHPSQPPPMHTNIHCSHQLCNSKFHSHSCCSHRLCSSRSFSQSTSHCSHHLCSRKIRSLTRNNGEGKSLLQKIYN